MLSTDKNIVTALNTLKKSPTGKDLINFATQHDVKIVITDDVDSDSLGQFDTDVNKVKIPLDFPFDNPAHMLLETLAHELRHAWQHHNNLLDTDDAWLYIPEYDASLLLYLHHMFINQRFCEADAFSTSAQVIFELIEQGVLSYNSLDDTYKNKNSFPFCPSFQEKILEGKANLYNGLARRSSFDQFFQKNTLTKALNCKSYDTATFEYVKDLADVMIDPYISNLWKYCVKNKKEHNKLKDIFNNTATNNREFMPSIKQLKKYGHMETGGNYLTGIAGKSLHSEYYISSNENDDTTTEAWSTIQKAAKQIYHYKF